MGATDVPDLLGVDELPPIPWATAAAVQERLETLVGRFNEALERRPEMRRASGKAPLLQMRQRHLDQARLFVTAFKLGRLDIIANSLPWLYRTYGSRGISGSFFHAAIACWRESANATLEPEHSAALTPLFDWMTRVHPRVVELAKRAPQRLTRAGDATPAGELLTALCEGDERRALELAQQHAQKPEQLSRFYTAVLCPCMREVGLLWEGNELEAAEVRVAAGIVERIIGAVGVQAAASERDKGSVFIACPANEHHAIGAQMLRDLLQLDGWKTTYLGADAGTSVILAAMDASPPDVLALSLTMPSNLEEVAFLIARVRSQPRLSRTRVVIGGQALAFAPGIGKELGADASSGIATASVESLRHWWAQRILSMTIPTRQ